MADVSSTFRSLPIATLIGSPFSAACRANIQMAQAMYDYLIKVSFVGGKEEGGTRLLSFALDQPVTTDGTVTTMPINVKAPFIGLAPIPSLLIDHVDVMFTMSISENVVDTDAQTRDESFGGTGDAAFRASGTMHCENSRTRTTNQTATYTINAEANQQPQTEGLGKLMDIMASCIAPISA